MTFTEKMKNINMTNLRTPPTAKPHNPTSDQETSIKFAGEWDSELAVKIQNAWFSSISMEFKLPEWVRYMDGASGKKYRYFINNMIQSLDDARYLEIGTWAGSTACSALYGNKVKTTCVDNWAEFGGPKDLFFSNIDKLKSPDIDFSFIENDFNLIDYTSIGKFNVYMYDGAHSEENQYNGVARVLPALDDTFLLVVDDWNWNAVRSGTLNAINDKNLSIVCSIEIRTMQQEVWWAPDILGSDSDWHNGYFIALIKKG